MRFPEALKPTLVLLFLSPAIGELLSSSSPPAEFFQPLGFLLLVGLYGCGALLVREAWVAWGGGPYRLLLLGAAYGIVEEGVMVRSFFCTTWPDLGIMAWYGRWLGVNWVWTAQLTVYHAVFSITIPVMLVELAFPDQGRRLGRRGISIALAAFVGVVLFGLVGFECEAPVIYVVMALASALALLWAGMKFGGPARTESGLPRTSTVIGTGIAYGAFILLGPWIMAAVGLPPILTFLSIVASFLFLVRWAVKHGFEKRAFDAVSSPLWAMIAFAFLQEFADRPDDTTGMSLVAVFFAALLIFMRSRLASR